MVQSFVYQSSNPLMTPPPPLQKPKPVSLYHILTLSHLSSACPTWQLQNANTTCTYIYIPLFVSLTMFTSYKLCHLLYDGHDIIFSSKKKSFTLSQSFRSLNPFFYPSTQTLLFILLCQALQVHLRVHYRNVLHLSPHTQIFTQDAHECDGDKMEEPNRGL